jgi:hypothetical protein
MNAQQIKISGKFVSIIAMIVSGISVLIATIPGSYAEANPELFKVVLAFGVFMGALGTYLAHHYQVVS